jgi:hypothetical protein
MAFDVSLQAKNASFHILHVYAVSHFLVKLTALRILRLSESSQGSTPEHKSSVGRGCHRIDASRNFWEGSGLKMDSASTDVRTWPGVMQVLLVSFFSQSIEREY